MFLLFYVRFPSSTISTSMTPVLCAGVGLKSHCHGDSCQLLAYLTKTTMFIMLCNTKNVCVTWMSLSSLVMARLVGITLSGIYLKMYSVSHSVLLEALKAFVQQFIYIHIQVSITETFQACTTNTWTEVFKFVSLDRTK